jgi:hypothetical protein
MQTQYKVSNFCSVTFLSNLNSSSLFHNMDMANLYPSNGTEGLIQKVSSIWKVKDHGSHNITWKLDT